MAIVLALAWRSPSQATPLDSGIARREVESRSYLSYATEALDNLMAFGTDRYGAIQSSLMVSNLDVRTKLNPAAHELARADEPWRVERRQRRAPGGANFLHNQSVYAAMLKASQATGDQAYAQFVDDNLAWAMNNLVDGNGMFWWGYHRHYDVHQDAFAAEQGTPHHEMHFVDVPLWDRMWAINPGAVRREIEGIWERHVVDKTTGQINRHDEAGGLSFITSSASFIDAFAFLASKSDGADYRTWSLRARLLANYNWDHRNPATDLLPHAPNETDRWDGFRAATSTPAVYVPALLRAYDFTGLETFREQAIAYLTGWAEHAYDPASGSFWASLQLDGTPVPGPWASGGYAQFEPRGLVDLWAPEFITAQYNPDAAKEYALAAARFDEPQLMAAAERWALLIQQSLPATYALQDTWYGAYSTQWAPHGTYAEHYGHAIQFFTAMYESTGDSGFLNSARDAASEAVSSLWYGGLFRGHPNKPYFEAVDGVGVLISALIELDGYSHDFELIGDFNDDGFVDEHDFLSVTANWLQHVEPYRDGDVTGDGHVSLADFHRFKQDLLVGADARATGVVPEPLAAAHAITAVVLLAILSKSWMTPPMTRRSPAVRSRILRNRSER